MHHILLDHKLSFCSVIFGSRGFKWGQILGCASSSTIPGTCDSQASCCWVSSAFLSLSYLCVSTNEFYNVIAIAGVIGLIVSGGFCYKILIAVWRHKNQIQALQIQQEAQNGQIANAARLRKSAISAFYVYLVFFLCYLPQLCGFVVVTISDFNTGVKVFFLFSTSLVFLNSALNPVIYCWKMRHIRRAVLDILRNIFPSHD